MGIPIPDTGSVTEDANVVGGLLSTNGDINYLFGDDTGEWTAVTDDTSLGYGSSFSMDEDGVWQFSVDNDDPGIQGLNDGETLEFQYTVSSNNGESTVTITVFGVDEPPCFARGTLIDTATGPRPVETLKIGDELLAADYGLVRIQWIGSKQTNSAEGLARNKFAPIEISPNALGPGVPSRTLVVSPLHRILCSMPATQLLFGESEVLCAAKMLVNGGTIRQRQDLDVEYFHILLADHHVITAEGCKSESLYPGRQGLYRFDAVEQEEIFALFPELRSMPESYGQSARPILRNYEAQLLFQYESA